MNSHPKAWLWQNKLWADFKMHVLSPGARSLVACCPSACAPCLRGPTRKEPHSHSLDTRRCLLPVRPDAVPSTSFADADEDSQPLYTLSLHSLVLAEASPGHLRGHCVRSKEQAEEQGAPTVGAKRARPDGPADEVLNYKVHLVPGEPQTAPEAVMKHLYTGELPEDPELLIGVRVRAMHFPRFTRSGCTTRR